LSKINYTFSLNVSFEDEEHGISYRRAPFYFVSPHHNIAQTFKHVSSKTTKHNCLLNFVGESSHFDGNIRIQDKLAINFDASELTFSYRKVVQIELVSEVINAKNFLFSHLNEKLRHGSHQSILLSVVGQSSHFDYCIQIQDKMAINFDASDLTLLYRKVVQLKLVAEVNNAKTFVFAFK